jgi:hypothetical protein
MGQPKRFGVADFLKVVVGGVMAVACSEFLYRHGDLKSLAYSAGFSTVFFLTWGIHSITSSTPDRTSDHEAGLDGRLAKLRKHVAALGGTLNEDDDLVPYAAE